MNKKRRPVKKRLAVTISEKVMEKLENEVKRCSLTKSQVVEECIENRIDYTSRWLRRKKWRGNT